MSTSRVVWLFVCVTCATTIPSAVRAQSSTGAPAQQAEPSAGSDADLAKQLSNPVASLVAVPLQFNWDQPVGIDDDTRLTLNFQPVIPLALNSDWNMIVRWIMPYIAQPRLFEGGVPSSGLSDVVASVFFSPATPGRFIWGAGPVVLLPMTADPVLGSAKWGVGPTAVVLKQLGGTSVGILANHIWSFAGDDFSGGVARADVNSTFLQPFLSHTTANAVTYTVNLEASAEHADERPTSSLASPGWWRGGVRHLHVPFEIVLEHADASLRLSPAPAARLVGRSAASALLRSLRENPCSPLPQRSLIPGATPPSDSLSMRGARAHTWR